ncbi:kinesin-like protein KIN-14P [Vicia villosa]|uniref:kinesin-like protein KIN-14P n=1 Tax=Vicia villosa TaxID=3911 RepID=UPI00273AA92E|nr:kinesin-like protein KIN-14P [Vicia villosa]
MNSQPSNHTTESKDVGSSSSNSSGNNNLPQKKILSDSKFQHMAEQSGALNQVGHRFPDVFQQKGGSYADLPAAKISELMKSSSLDNAPTQSLLSVVNGILEESVERRNGEIPPRVACLLRKVVQEIERRISTQQGHLRTQNNLFKTREEKYQSRIRVLEALASETKEENIIKEEKIAHDSKPIEKIVIAEKKENESMRNEKTKIEEKKTNDTIHVEKTKEDENKKEMDREVIRLMKEVEDKDMEKKEIDKEVKRLIKEVEEKNMEISTFKQELETMKKRYEVQCSKIENMERKEIDKEVEGKNMEKKEIDEEVMRLIKEVEEKNIEKKEIGKEVTRLIKEVEEKNMEISTMKQELETMKNRYEEQCSKLKSETKDAELELKQKSQEHEAKMESLRNKVRESEAIMEAKYQKWNMKQNIMQKALSFQFSSIQKLKLSWDSIKQDVVKERMIYKEECNRLGVNLKPLVHAAENYQTVLTENRKLFNELQELKGNIRVYCRIRPFIPGQKEKQSIVERIGESDLVVANPSKQGKEALKTFKFNKIFGPASTQAEVYDDIQAFIRSVLDGFNVCIFAYGQTGSGKTYTMSGPNGATNESLGVNYRALNDLFNISSSRQSSIVYEIGVQIIEIYNEQVRDLLSTDTSVKKLGILSHSQPNGLAVPDASMHPVKSTADVIKLMDIGLKNRAKGSTAMNERSSRSHSVVSIHVRGADKKSGSTLQGNLHLIDLAGSERIDRSEVIGDRLKEAQHINKSLSALGDVIFALSQKSSHIPYRNSKLTQILQSSLGGHAKTLMLVQINSDVKSYSESLSTLKFAERVSGVELGVAKSTKDGRDVRELMEQVASLKDTISTKDEEIERLQLLKDLKNVSNSEKLED